MNELSKANEWEFWDYEVSASDYILPHVEGKTTPMHEEEDDIDRAWRQFDSYESIIHSPHTAAVQAKTKSEYILPSHVEDANQIHEEVKAQDKTTSLLEKDPEKESPGLNNVKSNCKGARAA